MYSKLRVFSALVMRNPDGPGTQDQVPLEDFIAPDARVGLPAVAERDAVIR